MRIFMVGKAEKLDIFWENLDYQNTPLVYWNFFEPDFLKTIPIFDFFSASAKGFRMGWDFFSCSTQTFFEKYWKSVTNPKNWKPRLHIWRQPTSLLTSTEGRQKGIGKTAEEKRDLMIWTISFHVVRITQIKKNENLHAVWFCLLAKEVNVNTWVFFHTYFSQILLFLHFLQFLLICSSGLSVVNFSWWTFFPLPIVRGVGWIVEIAVESLKSHSIPIQKLSRNSGQVS